MAPVIATTESALTTCARGINEKPMGLAKIHAMAYASVAETIIICDEAGWLSPELRSEIEKVGTTCESYTQAGALRPSQKISLNHINQAFNDKVQIDFKFI